MSFKKYISDFDLIYLCLHHDEHLEISKSKKSGIEILLGILKKVLEKAGDANEIMHFVYELDDLIKTISHEARRNKNDGS